MRNLGLAAFGVTTCVLVPTALHVLDAGPVQTAKLLAADAQTVQLGNAKVDISVDKGLVQGGGTFHVTLTATADRRARVPVEVLVYEQQGVDTSRVENPPVRIGRGETTLDVPRAGKASRTLAFTIPDSPTRAIDDGFGHYTILVMSPAAADALDAKRRRAHGIDPGNNDPNGFWAALDVATNPQQQDADHKAGTIARLDVYSHATSDHVKIVAGDVARANADIAVKVHVRNPTGRRFAEVEVGLDTQPATQLGSAWLGIGLDHVDVDHNPDATFALGPHASKEVVFHLRTDQPGTLGLVASVRCTADDCFRDDRVRATDALDDTVLDAIDVLPAGDAPGQVATAEVAP
jgi:hypothetical protein